MKTPGFNSFLWGKNLLVTIANIYFQIFGRASSALRFPLTIGIALKVLAPEGRIAFSTQLK